MLLSILIPGKNDNYAADENGKGGVCKRLELSLNKLSDNLSKLNKDDIEVVVCDWGSENKISDELVHNKHKSMKFVYVPKEIASKYNRGAGFSIVHPYNTAFRNSSGRYTIFWDSDCFVPYESLERLYNFVSDLDKKDIIGFFWGSRFHIPRVGYVDAKDFSDVDEYMKTCVIDIRSPHITNSPKILRHDKANISAFGGGAMALLMNRQVGEESTCWWEELTYWGWQDIEINNRLRMKYPCLGDIEDHGVFLFHLDHHEKTHFTHSNPSIVTNRFNANDENWGLANEKLEIIQ